MSRADERKALSESHSLFGVVFHAVGVRMRSPQRGFRQRGASCLKQDFFQVLGLFAGPLAEHAAAGRSSCAAVHHGRRGFHKGAAIPNLNRFSRLKRGSIIQSTTSAEL